MSTLRVAVFLVAALSALPASAATLVVTNLQDDLVAPPAGSLRERYGAASANDVITFSSELDGATLQLEGTLFIARSVSIDASSLPNGIVLSGARVLRPLLVGVGTTVQLTGFTVADGYATSGGGAIENGGRLTLERMTLRDSISAGGNGAGCGGGICNQASGVLTINNSSIIHNVSFFLGGGIGALNGGTLTVTNSLIAFNESANTGGGICVRTVGSPGTSTLTNVTVTGNRAGFDGASSVDGVGFVKTGVGTNNATVRNSTIAFNTGSGFGIVSTGAMSIGNSLAWGNAAPDIGATQGGTVTSLGHNLAGTSSGFNAAAGDLLGQGIDPRLSALGSYGGPTQTFGLLPGSPAINAGLAKGAPATDQRGIARTSVDIGAFESRGFTLALTGNDQRTLASTPFAVPLGVRVIPVGNEPVDAGRVTLTPPGAGARLTTGTTVLTLDNTGEASLAVTANAVAGTFNVAVTAAGAQGAAFTLTNLQAVSFSPLTLPQVVANSPYQEEFTGIGGTGAYTFTVTGGRLPPGLSLTLDGVLAGVPTTAGSYTFSVTASDSGAPYRATRAYTMVITCPPTTIAPLADGVVGEPYAELAYATPPTAYTFDVTQGALPEGLVLESEGLLSGVVTAPGVATFTLRARGFGSCLASARQVVEFRCAHCDIGGACVDAGQLDPSNACAVCDPFVSETGYSPRPAGVSCPDDGLATTADRCDGAGQCVHESLSVCEIDGVIHPAGAGHPSEACLTCEPWRSSSAWSPRAAGTACPDDGLTCTRDVCDDAGQCIHPVLGGCLIAGACVAPGALDPTKECAACDPFIATDSYSARPDGVSCAEDGDPCTLDTCEGGVCGHERLLCPEPVEPGAEVVESEVVGSEVVESEVVESEVASSDTTAQDNGDSAESASEVPTTTRQADEGCQGGAVPWFALLMLAYRRQRSYS